MVNEEAQKTLNDMYVLRAGLSLMSQQADNVKKTEESIKSAQEQIAQEFIQGREEVLFDGPKTVNHWLSCQRQDDVAVHYENLSKIANYGEHISTAAFGGWLGSEESKEYYREYFNNLKREKHSAAPTFLIFWLLNLILLGGVILGIVMFFRLWEDYIWQPPVFLGIAIVCAISLFFCIMRSKESYEHWSSETYQRKHIKSRLSKINKIDFQTLLNESEQKNKEIEKRKTEELTVAKTKSSAVYNSIKSTYGKLLDERDWKYLDLIIYYFETGRADTMKEALQLVESETQTQRIVKAIEKSARYIVGAIRDAAESISGQLSAISTQLNNVMLLQQVQIDQNKILISQGEMRNALIKKSNATSEKLMKDVTYIKNYKL